MKRENLYLVGGALLASTALSTAAHAVALGLGASGGAGILIAKTTTNNVNAQVLSSTADTATVLGPRVLFVRFATALGSKFDTATTITGARFKTANIVASALSVQFVNFDNTTGSIIAIGLAGSIANGCTVTVVTDRIILTGCDPTTANAAGVTGSLVEVDGFLFSTVSFDNAGSLATAAATVMADNIITSGSFTIEQTAAAAIITSKNGITASITAATTPVIDITSTPSFVKVGNATSAIALSTVNITWSNTVQADLVTASTVANAAASFEAKITSAVTGDDATKSVNFKGTTTVLSQTPTQYGSGFVTFTVTGAASVNEAITVSVDFNGTGLIDQTAAGTGTITWAAPTSGSAAPASSGTVAGLNRSGLNIDFNSFQPSVGQGAVTYTSLLRVANTGANAGTVSVVLTNDTTGVVLGTYTSASVPSGAAIQLTAAALESGSVPAVTPSASVLYRLRVTGNITGYAQHVNWNQTAGFFSDLSGRRTAVTSAD